MQVFIKDAQPMELTAELRVQLVEELQFTWRVVREVVLREYGGQMTARQVQEEAYYFSPMRSGIRYLTWEEKGEVLAEAFPNGDCA